MKKEFHSNRFILSVLIVLAFTVNACEEKDDYDYNKIIPAIQRIAGTVVPMQGRHYEYAATIRGGSTYAWTLGDAEIVPITGIAGAWKTNIYFPNAITSADAPEVISITETTMGGITSAAKTFTIDSITPFAALPISGPELVNGGFSASYFASPSALDKVFSAYTWETTAGTITPSATEPWKMQISFSNEDVGDVVISLIEETTKGMSDTSYYDVTVLEYCALTENADMVGVWSGDDAFYAAEIESSEADEDGIILHGINSMFIFDFWGEDITEEGDVKMIINVDGTVTIASQYLFTTSYNSAPYEYWIEGEGRWNNCGEFPTLTFTYTVYNKTDDYTLPADYSSYFDGAVVFTAELVMDGGSGPEILKFLTNPLKNIDVKRTDIR